MARGGDKVKRKGLRGAGTFLPSSVRQRPKARLDVGYTNVCQRLRGFGMGSKFWGAAAAEGLNIVLEWKDLAVLQLLESAWHP